MTRPILYSFVRCPYAIRARMACNCSGTEVELREVDLKNKPQALIQASAKATVPVFVDIDGRVIDESQAIVEEQLTLANVNCQQPEDLDLIEQLHRVFIPALVRYKYPERFEAVNLAQIQTTLQDFLAILNKTLQQRAYTDEWQYLDVMVLPLVRQCYKVDTEQFNDWGFTEVNFWLQSITESERFKALMIKREPWKPN